MSKKSSRIGLVIILFLISFIIALYFLDLFEFDLTDWNIENHIPRLIILHPISNISSINNIKSFPKRNNFSELFSNSHHFINGNPFLFPQCKNAILQKENIKIEDFILQHTKHLNKRAQEQIRSHFDDIIWSRELLYALKNKLNFGHLIRLRLSFDANNKDWKGSRLRNKNEPLHGYMNKEQLVYYHISKCGSSSIHNMLNEQYNTTRMFWRDLLDIDAFGPIPDIDCAFTFIRHPIDRIISGYYTIKSMLEREFKHNANGNASELIRIKQEYGSLHTWFGCNESAKVCFKLFVEEVIERGYKYVIEDHLILHVASQIGGSIGNFHRWPIHFIGRMEFFEAHWNKLTMKHEQCSKVFDSNRIMRSDEIAHAMKRMGHQSSIDSDDVGGNDTAKLKLKQKGVSAEHFVFINDKELFQRTVDYYFQDFVCFGYNMTHDAYLKHINNKYYI